MSSAPRPRPKYYDLSLAHLPPPGLVSIFHRISGILLFFPILPLLLYLLHCALADEQGYRSTADFFSRTPVKLAMLAVLWLYAHHFWAGLRYLIMDVHWQVTKNPARKTAIVVFVLGFVTTVLVGWRLW